MKFATSTALAMLLAAPAFAATDAAGAPDKASVLETYADIALAGYEDSLSTAKALQEAVEALIAEPSEETLAAARERERLRIAREIHDGPLQALHALRRLLEADGHTAFEQDLLEIVRELRRVVENLRPPALDRYSLADALRSLIRRFERHNPGVEVDATLAADSDAVDAYSDELRLTLYRLTQEALNNVGAHARAHHVEIAFDARADRYALTVGDDGAGFDPERHPDDDRGHFGLLGMRERVEAVDARLMVASRPGHGTRLRLDGTPRPA